MSTTLPYHKQIDIQYTQKLRQLITTLPPYAKDFFRGIEPRTSSRTRIAYAYDLSVFFQFLHDQNPVLAQKDVTEITLEELEAVTPKDLEEYMEYLKYYDAADDSPHYNQSQGIKRKISSIKSFYRYFYEKMDIEKNPASLIRLPRIHGKQIIKLDVNEIVLFLDSVEKGESLTPKQKQFHEKTKVRDLAIMTLLLGTGLRVSECVGLDIADIDFDNSGVKIHRKGGKEVMVYFGEEVELALLDYLEERMLIIPADGHENALFLSLQKKRIGVRTVENMVHKYAASVTTVKNITPHKLRSTYGTQLYQETGDIYLVADVLGHSDVNTTRRHYAALEDERRRSARSKVRLREAADTYPVELGVFDMHSDLSEERCDPSEGDEL